MESKHDWNKFDAQRVSTNEKCPRLVVMNDEGANGWPDLGALKPLKTITDRAISEKYRTN